MVTFPLLHVLILAACKVTEATVVCFIMPFVNRMVVGFGYSPTVAAKYAGLIESALVLSEAICAPLWGRLADRYGRKYLLVSGLAAFTVATLGIGLSRSLWMAITSRCLSGIMGAVSVLVRTVQFEVVDASQLPKMLEILTPCWAIGAAIGPLIGGTLAEPAETMRFLFNGRLWRTYPYLLSAIGTAVLPAGCAVACWFWLPETLGRQVAVSSEQIVTEVECVAEYASVDSASPTLLLLKTPSLTYPFLLASLLAFVSMGYCSGFMMFASSPVAEGGLDLSPEILGILLAVSSIIGVFYGYYGSLRRTAAAHPALFVAIALTQQVAKVERGTGRFTKVLLALVLALHETAEASYTFLDVAFADRTPPGCLGSVNGLAASAYSVGRMIAPIASGFLWSWSISARAALGSSLIWIVYASVSLLWWLATLRLHSPLELALRSDADLGERGQLKTDTIKTYSTFGADSPMPKVAVDSCETLNASCPAFTGASTSTATFVCGTPTPKKVLPKRGQKMFLIGDWSDEEDVGGHC